MEFLFPSNGLNWLQGDQGESGLPDIRGQSGFIADNERYLSLPGSGTENVSSNFNVIQKLRKYFCLLMNIISMQAIEFILNKKQINQI